MIRQIDLTLYSAGPGYGYIYGYGYGYSDGDGDGDGYGDGHGSGSGYGYGSGLVWISPKTPILAWWYVGEYSNLHFNQSLSATVGEIHKWPYRPNLCQAGLHASLKPEDAAKYREGKLCRVACSGWVMFDRDKFVCTRRKVIGND
jgi:hypothetical protein